MTDEELAVTQDEQTDVEGGEEEPSADEKAMARLKEAVEVEREDLGGLRVKLRVTVPRDILDERLGEQFAELRREAMIPGFRKGRAPLKLVEKRFASDVGEELKGKLVGSGYMAAVEKEEIKALGDPLIWVKAKEDRVADDGRSQSVDVEKLMSFDKALDHLVLPKEGPLSFTCELELKPQFDLPTLEKIPVQKPAITIDDEDVEAEIRRFRMLRGTHKPVEDAPVEQDDMLYTTAKMTVGEETIFSEDNFDVPARDVRIRGVLLNGLGNALIGRKVGQTGVVEAAVPDDHENADLRGKTAKFEFTVREIKRLELPLLDDGFAVSLGYDDLKDLRSSLKTRLAAEVDGIVARRMKDQVAAYLIDQTKLEIPTGLSQRQTERALARRMIEMYQAGYPEAEIEKAVDEARGTREQVVRDLQLYFILEKSPRIGKLRSAKNNSTPPSPRSPTGRTSASTGSATSWPRETEWPCCSSVFATKSCSITLSPRRR